MIPPINRSILDANPAFAKLYEHLSTALVASDCQTAVTVGSTARAETIETLKKKHLQVARRSLLIEALRAVACDADNGLDRGARERCLVAGVVLQRSFLSEDESRLLKPDVEKFKTDLEIADSKISSLLSGYLDYQHRSLLQIANPGSDKASARSRQHSSSLDVSIAKRTADLQRQKQVTLPSRQMMLANTSASLMSLYRSLLSLQIQHLERYTHGIETRSTKSQSEYLSTVSAGMASKAKILFLQARQEIYSDEVQDALATYAEHLSTVEERLGEKEKQLSDELRLYQEQGEARMRECGRRYTSVIKGVEETKREIERLTKREDK